MKKNLYEIVCILVIAISLFGIFFCSRHIEKTGYEGTYVYSENYKAAESSKIDKIIIEKDGDEYLLSLSLRQCNSWGNIYIKSEPIKVTEKELKHEISIPADKVEISGLDLDDYYTVQITFFNNTILLNSSYDPNEVLIRDNIEVVYSYDIIKMICLVICIIASAALVLRSLKRRKWLVPVLMGIISAAVMIKVQLDYNPYQYTLYAYNEEAVNEEAYPNQSRKLITDINVNNGKYKAVVLVIDDDTDRNTAGYFFSGEGDKELVLLNNLMEESYNGHLFRDFVGATVDKASIKGDTLVTNPMKYDMAKYKLKPLDRPLANAYPMAINYIPALILLMGGAFTYRYSKKKMIQEKKVHQGQFIFRQYIYLAPEFEGIKEYLTENVEKDIIINDNIFKYCDELINSPSYKYQSGNDILSGKEYFDGKNNDFFKVESLNQDSSYIIVNGKSDYIIKMAEGRIVSIGEMGAANKEN